MYIGNTCMLHTLIHVYVECSGGEEGLNPLFWIIPLVVIGSLLVLGIILLAIVLLVIWSLVCTYVCNRWLRIKYMFACVYNRIVFI